MKCVTSTTTWQPCLSLARKGPDSVTGMYWKIRSIFYFHACLLAFFSSVPVPVPDVDREDPGRPASCGDTNTSHAASVVHCGPPATLDTPPGGQAYLPCFAEVSQGEYCTSDPPTSHHHPHPCSPPLHPPTSHLPPPPPPCPPSTTLPPSPPPPTLNTPCV